MVEEGSFHLVRYPTVLVSFYIFWLSTLLVSLISQIRGHQDIYLFFFFFRKLGSESAYDVSLRGWLSAMHYGG